jgi:DNA-binding MarR family transcriptional regulator
MQTKFTIEGAEESGRRVRHRLGVVGWPGFAPVPHLLLLHQNELGITSRELNVFLNIFMHWHDAERLPFPSTATIAKRMGLSQRAVQDTVNSLRKKGMLEKVRERRKQPMRYDVRPMFARLTPRAREWMALRGLEVPNRQQQNGEPINIP